MGLTYVCVCVFQKKKKKHGSDLCVCVFQKKKKKQHGSDSDHSYYSEVSEGGTRRTMRRKRIRDKDGKVIGHGAPEEYESQYILIHTQSPSSPTSIPLQPPSPRPQ